MQLQIGINEIYGMKTEDLMGTDFNEIDMLMETQNRTFMMGFLPVCVVIITAFSLQYSIRESRLCF